MRKIDMRLVTRAEMILERAIDDVHRHWMDARYNANEYTKQYHLTELRVVVHDLARVCEILSDLHY